jgi:hypothetical protein
MDRCSPSVAVRQTTGGRERRKMGARFAWRSASTPKPECPNPRRVRCSAEKASLLY